jgi:pSer/pThr/pTyr-binding forkhead associated (FHA) protein
MSGPVVFALRAILAAILYTFLILTLITLWRELKQQSILLGDRKIPPISLAIQHEGHTPQVRHFHQPEITIGRNSACDYQVKEDSVSSRHARLRFHHGQWWLEDVGSTNGTALNGVKLDLPTVIVSGDEVRCGETRFVITFSGDLNTSPIQELAKKNDS